MGDLVGRGRDICSKTEVGDGSSANLLMVVTGGPITVNQSLGVVHA